MPRSAIAKRTSHVIRRQRRKDARPSEIIAAAIDVFAEHGFMAARLEEVARRAGVAKGTVFVYFPTKQDLFRAVARSVLSTSLSSLRNSDPELAISLSELVPSLLVQAARTGESRVAAVIRMLLAEARTFPDLAQVWHDEVVAKVLGTLTSAIARAQERGEVRAGDPRLHAFSIIGPMLAGTIFRQVFQETGAKLPDLRRLAVQHGRTVLAGLLTVKGAKAFDASTKKLNDRRRTRI
jgi:AcrR family transcriptional regulator